MFIHGFLLIASLSAQMPSHGVSISSALAELNKGNVLESIEQFKDILRSEPASAAPYFYLSTLYTQMNQLEVAERYVRRAMELSPRQGAHYLQLGLIRYRQKQWRPALEFLKQALEFGAGSNEAAAWRSIGDVQVELFDRDAALQAYETSLRIQPQDATTRLALGRFYLDRSETERAIAHLSAALDIDPLLRAAYPVLGRAYRQAGDLPNAIANLRRALETDPADQQSRYALGQALLSAGREEEGRAELEKYESISRLVSTANTRYTTAQSLLDEGKPAQAEPLLREAVRLAPAYGPALHSLGVLLLERGSARDGAEFLKRAVQVNPLNGASWFSLASASLKLGKLSEAQEAARRAVVLDDEDKASQRLLADIQARMKK